MRRKIILILLVLFISLTSLLTTGCASILEGSALDISRHVGTGASRPQGDFFQAANFDELELVILGFVERFESSGRVVIYSYDGDVQDDVNRVIYEIKNNHPIGAFAVYDIVAVVSTIVTHFEIDINIEYNRTEQQVESIIAVETHNDLRDELFRAMSEYSDELVIRSTVRGMSAERVVDLVRDVYYQNPRHIVMMPSTAIVTFPETGRDVIFEIHFGHMHQALVLRRMATSLIGSVLHNADAAYGENEAKIVLSLTEILIRAADFDEGAATTISEHGVQNPVATAHGALVNGVAVGEGFAMAFKALCDELGIDSWVVLGYLDGMIHAWNIVHLFGNFYHIDVAMSEVNGIYTAFLKTDVEFAEMGYVWDTANTMRADGELTYEAVRSMQHPFAYEDDHYYDENYENTENTESDENE
jgi:hypothetical protein